MIKASGLVKKYGEFTALRSLDAEIPSGSVYGLIGPNGSGKSTLLRLIAGIYQPDCGAIQVDGLPVYEHPAVKGRIFFVSDELFFFPSYSMDDTASFYAGIYCGWDWERYRRLCSLFPVDAKKKLNTFSKGMQRQVALIMALSACPDYLLLDEAFDGLDSIVRNALRKLLADDVASREMTVLISSHNLRELEDVCDHIGFLYQGRILFERELDQIKLDFCKVQAVFQPMIPRERIAGLLELLQFEQRGSLVSLVVRGGSKETIETLQRLGPLFVEALPLTLEEVFIQEMEAAGYDYSNVVF